MKYITSLEGDALKYGFQLQFPATNNEAEYEAILTGFRLAKSMEAEKVLLKSDFGLVIGQIKGDYEEKEQRMQKYLKVDEPACQRSGTSRICASSKEFEYGSK